MFNRNGGSDQARGENDIIVAIDLGSSFVRIIAGKVSDEGQVDVLGYSCSSPDRDMTGYGVDKGAIIDIDRLSTKVAELLQQFKSDFGIQVQSCYVGVPGGFIHSFNEKGTATVQSGIVTVEDRNRAVENAKAGVKLDPEDQIIHVIPQNYITPTSSEVQNPIGQYARRIDVAAHVISCKISHVKNVNRVISKVATDLIVRDPMYNGIAAATAVLAEGEKQISVGLIDIGGGTVSVAIYDNKRLILSFGIDGGGDLLTQQIAKRFGLSLNYAERLKLQFGVACPYVLNPEEYNFQIKINAEDPGTGQINTIYVKKGELGEVIYGYLADLFSRVCDTIARLCVDRHLSLGAGYVVTGGVANMPGLEKMFDDLITRRYNSDMEVTSGKKVRIGRPRGISSNVISLEELSRPENAVAVGLLRSAREPSVDSYDPKNRNGGGKDAGFLQKLKIWFKNEF